MCDRSRSQVSDPSRWPTRWHSLHALCMSCTLDGMTVLIQIRDVDEVVRERLKERAARDGVSLNSLLKQILAREAEVPSRAEVLDRIGARPPIVLDDSVEVIAEMRAERDRQLHA